MRSLTGFTIGALLSGFAAANTPQTYHFSVHVVVEDADPIVVNAEVVAGSARSIEVAPDLRYEIKVPVTVGPDAPIVVRLVRGVESARSTIYEGRSVSAAPAHRVLVYKVCNRVTSFTEELPEAGVRCEAAK